MLTSDRMSMPSHALYLMAILGASGYTRNLGLRDFETRGHSGSVKKHMYSFEERVHQSKVKCICCLSLLHNQALIKSHP
ncbi:hypothetical protein EV702DRAFT_1151464 [Suillus placidus]|uniref:Uncharacterized protein n=1 Tax=Suillus placidus TaxID=48579 RepID=A0A9P6ZGS8_9AGAM|nr:hypothetical protein EV702DRAFT_1151464 [Suillus placidus]